MRKWDPSNITCAVPAVFDDDLCEHAVHSMEASREIQRFDGGPGGVLTLDVPFPRATDFRCDDCIMNWLTDHLCSSSRVFHAT